MCNIEKKENAFTYTTCSSNSCKQNMKCSFSPKNSAKNLRISVMTAPSYSPRNVFITSLIFLILVVSSSYASDTSDRMCSPALNQLVHLGVATSDMINQLPSNGSEVCRGGPCCMPRMSDKMLTLGRQLLHEGLQKETNSLLEAITITREGFRGAVEVALRRSEERTMESFRLSYPRLVGHAKEPIRELFSSLHASLITTEADSVERAMDTFWDDMFPLVYHSTVHSRLPPFTAGYMECLRKSRKSMKPWKTVPNLIAQSLIRGMDTAKLMMNILNVATDVVLNARQYEIPEECGNSAARLHFCGICHAITVSPCSGFCLNVARGCLAPLAELNSMWNSMGTAAMRVDEAVKATDLARLLKDLPERFSDSIMIAMESGHKLQKLVRNKCGPYIHEKSDEWEAKSKEGLAQRKDASILEPQVDVEGDALNAKATEVVRTLRDSHNFWKKMADKTCSQFSEQEKCWNGDKIGSYSRQVARIGFSAQKYNPEVQVLRPDATVFSIADNMRNVKRTIAKVLSWMPEASTLKKVDDSSSEREEGSGFESLPGDPYTSTVTDDEDAGQENEMGSGYPPTHTDGVGKTDHSKGDDDINRPPVIIGSGGSSSGLFSSNLLLRSCAAVSSVVFLLYYHRPIQVI